MAWLPRTVPAPTDEPVTLAQARVQVQLLEDDTDLDANLVIYIASARAHCEARCSMLFAQRDILARCTSFSDLARLPVTPVFGVLAITYIDTDGTEQTLPDTVYELQADGLEAAIALKPGQIWPQIAANSRITVDLDAGGQPPADVLHAMLLFIADSVSQREHAKSGDWTTLDTLLCNHLFYP